MSRSYARLDDDGEHYNDNDNDLDPSGVTSLLHDRRLEHDIGDTGVLSPWHERSALNPIPITGTFSPSPYDSNGGKAVYTDEQELTDLNSPPLKKYTPRMSLKSRLSTFSGIGDDDDGKPPEFVRWGVGWRQPLAMVVLFILGIITCAGHHIYYQYHVGRAVGDSTNQNVIVAIGTGFTFLALFFLNSANGIAITQYIWIVVKRHAMTIGGLDKLFGINSDVTSFISWELWKRCKFALFLGLVCW
jgi:hypothetical protein